MSRLLDAISAIARHEAQRRSFCELAEVTSVFDGEDGPDAHTVSVRLKDSGLAVPRVPLATSLTGAAALPREGDVVVVLFARGDLSAPVAVAQVYSSERRPPEFTRDKAKLVWPGDVQDPDTEAAQLWVKSDGSEREVVVSLGGDEDATIRVANGEVHMQSGGVSLRLSHSSDSDGEVEVSAGGTRVRLSQDGDLSLESAGTLTLKANEIALEADTRATLNGQTVEIN